MKSKKNIVVTGTSRGIGYELVQRFAKAGHQVLALSRNVEPIRSLEMDQLTAMPFDISKDTDSIQVEDFIRSEWKKVDIMIHNAGALVNSPFLKTAINDFKRVYEVNVFGAARLSQIVIPFMAKGSHVIAVSSMGGVQGSVKFGGLSAYSSSKAAIIALHELLAEEFKEKGIAFNTLALGAVQTEMLEEAFPGYRAPLSAKQMADYIYDFSLNGNTYYNGKTLQVSSTTP